MATKQTKRTNPTPEGSTVQARLDPRLTANLAQLVEHFQTTLKNPSVNSSDVVRMAIAHLFAHEFHEDKQPK